MPTKILVTAAFLLITLLLVVYVYPTHPVVVWSLLGLCWACYRLSLRAQNLFGPKSARTGSSWSKGLTQNSRNADRLPQS